MRRGGLAEKQLSLPTDLPAPIERRENPNKRTVADRIAHTFLLASDYSAVRALARCQAQIRVLQENPQADNWTLEVYDAAESILTRKVGKGVENGSD